MKKGGGDRACQIWKYNKDARRPTIRMWGIRKIQREISLQHGGYLGSVRMAEKIVLIIIFCQGNLYEYCRSLSPKW